MLGFNVVIFHCIKWVEQQGAFQSCKWQMLYADLLMKKLPVHVV